MDFDVDLSIYADSIFYSRKYKSNFMSFRYEDIALNPKSTLKKIYKFLNLSSDHNLLNEKEWLDASGNKFIHNSVFTNKKARKDDFDFKASVLRWKNQLNSSEIAFCQYVNRDMMREFDYKINNKSNNFNDILPAIFNDEKIYRYFKNWLLKNKGVEEFPNDPLNPKNWDENN